MITEEKKYRLSDYSISVFAFSETGQGKVENQDSFALYSDDNQLIIAVADGLGSASYSKEGSQKIVSDAVDILSRVDSYENISSAILQQWKNGLEGNLNQYDTTLKFVKISAGKIVYGGIGDGWIALSGSCELTSLTTDNTFSNQTDSILSFDLNRKFVVEEVYLENVKMGLIATDGFSEDMDKENAKQMLEEIERELAVNEEAFVREMERTLAQWPIKTNCDDKTVVFIKTTKEDI